MPYQPINPVPHNIGIEANKDNYTFSFEADKYDKIEKVEIRIYDYYNNSLHLYTITRSYNESNQFIEIYDEVKKDFLFEHTLITNELEEFSRLPVIGGKEDSSEFYLPLGLLNEYDATNLFKGNKKYSWNVKLTGDKHDVWITENNTFADDKSYLPTIYVPNNTRIEPNQQIVLGGDSTYRINNVERYSHEGKIYYRQSKGKATNTLSYYSMLNGYINYNEEENGVDVDGDGIKTITSATITGDEFIEYLTTGTSFAKATEFEITDVSNVYKKQTITEINGNTIKFDPGFTSPGKGDHNNLITITTNEEETEGALIQKAIIPNEWIYLFNKGWQSANSVDFYYKGKRQQGNQIAEGSNIITFSPGFICTKEGDFTAEVSLAQYNNILPSDIGEYDIIIIGDEEMNKINDLTDMHITLNYINYFKVDYISQYSNKKDYYKYGLNEGEMLFKITSNEIINPTKYQVDSPALAKDYLLERQSSILTVDPNALEVKGDVMHSIKVKIGNNASDTDTKRKVVLSSPELTENFTVDDFNITNEFIKLNYTDNNSNSYTLNSKIEKLDTSIGGNFRLVCDFGKTFTKNPIIDENGYISNVKNFNNYDRVGGITVSSADEWGYFNDFEWKDLIGKYITFECLIDNKKVLIENQKIIGMINDTNGNKILLFNFPETMDLYDITRFEGNIITNNLVYIFDKVSEDNDEYIPLILTADDIVNPNQSFVIYSDNIISPYYYFSVLPEKKIEFYMETIEGFKPPENDVFNVNSTRVKINAKYDGNIDYYTWKLVRDNGEEEDEIIEQTKEQFTAYMEYEYEMLEPGSYKLTLIITTEEGCIVQSTVSLNVDYEIMNNPFDIKATIDCDRKAIKVSFSDFKQIKGYVYKQNANGKYVLIGDNNEEKSLEGFEITSLKDSENAEYYNCYIKPEYKIQWDKIIPLENNTYIDISKNFTLMSRFKLGEDFNGNILELIDLNGVSYSLSLVQDNNNINFVMKKGTAETTTNNSGLYTGTALELQTETLIETEEDEDITNDVVYYYFDFSEENQLDFSSETSKFIVERDPASEEWFTMVMKKGTIEIYRGEITEEKSYNYKLDLDMIETETTYNKIMAYGNINWNYIHVFNGNMEEDYIKQILYNNNYIPDWSLNSYMLMNFISNMTPNINIDAVPINNEYFLNTLSKFVLFRSEIDDNGKITPKRKLAEIQPSRTAFYDYAIEKKRKYIYTIIPYFYTVSKNDLKFIMAGSPMSTSESGIGLFYDYISLYSGISLYLNEELSYEGNLKQSENTYLLDSTQKPWYFKYNLESGDISINTDKNVFEGLFPYAKVNKGLKNYRTGSVTALIGEFKESSDSLSSLIYYDSIKMADEFQAFCDTNTVKILRDEMGNIIPVDITLKSIKYDNKSMPSTIIVSFEWTQVDSHETVSLFEVEDERSK